MWSRNTWVAIAEPSRDDSLQKKRVFISWSMTIAAALWVNT
jgi:hypothetical protein